MEQPGPSGASSVEQPGLSAASSVKQPACAGPRSKKRKMTKMEKIEKSNRELSDDFFAVQEKTMRGFMELEERRMEWQAEQVRKGDKREMRFTTFNVFQCLHLHHPYHITLLRSQYIQSHQCHHLFLTMMEKIMRNNSCATYTYCTFLY